MVRQLSSFLLHFGSALLVLSLTTTCVSDVSAAGTNNHVTLPNTTFLNETWISWTLDWTFVGTSFLGCFNCLIYGPTPIAMVQRLRGVRGQAGRHCSWSTHFIALTADGEDERVLDRADTPTGFAVGDERERSVIGLFWANLVLAVVVLVAHVAASLGLEYWALKKATEARGGAPLPPDGRGVFKKVIDICAKWGIGRTITGIVMLPVYSVFRISCITVGARRQLASGTLLHAIIALAVSIIILFLYSFVLPLIAVMRCTCERIGGGDPDADEIDLNEYDQNGLVIPRHKTADELEIEAKQQAMEDRPWIVKFWDDKVAWKFLAVDDPLALIAVAPVDPLRSLKWWWWPFFELCATAAIDLAPLSAGSYNDSCFDHAMVGMCLVAILALVGVCVSPYQKSILNWFFCVALVTETVSFFGAVLRASTLRISPQSQAEWFLYPTYIACYCLVAVSFLFLIVPGIRKLCCRSEGRASQSSTSSSGEKKNKKKMTWDEELLAMLSVAQVASTRAGLEKKSKTKTAKLFKPLFKSHMGGSLSTTSLALPMLDSPTSVAAVAPAPIVSVSVAPSAAPSLGGELLDQQEEFDALFKASI